MTHKRKKLQGSSSQGVQLGLIITPMLDMSFQLLAFFIMTYHPSALEGHIPGSLVPPEDFAKKSKDNNPTPQENPLSVPEEELLPELQESITVKIKSVAKGQEQGTLVEGSPAQIFLKTPQEAEPQLIADPTQIFTKDPVKDAMVMLDSKLKDMIAKGATEKDESEDRRRRGFAPAVRDAGLRHLQEGGLRQDSLRAAAGAEHEDFHALTPKPAGEVLRTCAGAPQVRSTSPAGLFPKALCESGFAMAVALIVVCTKCEKKFKPKNDVRGKKIKCPFCEHSFVVPAAKEAKTDKDKPDGAKTNKGKPEAPKPEAAPPPAPTPEEVEDLDGSPDPYAVKNVELVPRCPNCTEEMGSHDIICLACGYNTLTRSWGKTEKKKANTFGRQFKYLLPGLGAAAFIFFSVVGMIFNATVSPFLVDGTMFWFTDSEAIRMWSTVFFLFWVFGAGVFCFKKFIEFPQPEELEME